MNSRVRHVYHDTQQPQQPQQPRLPPLNKYDLRGHVARGGGFFDWLRGIDQQVGNAILGVTKDVPVLGDMLHGITRAIEGNDLYDTRPDSSRNNLPPEEGEEGEEGEEPRPSFFSNVGDMVRGYLTGEENTPNRIIESNTPLRIMAN